MNESNPNTRHIVQVFVGALSQHYEALSVEASKQTTSEEIVSCIVERLSLGLGAGGFELAEVVGDALGRECKERRLGPLECPAAVMHLWPKSCAERAEYYRFYLREKLPDSLWAENFTMDPQLIKDYFYRFLYQPQDREYPDLCQLPDLNEKTLMENLRARFTAGHIYTYVGSILIAVNPFKFHPIYNPKYVKLYQNRRLGPELPPHIFAVADLAYHSMLRERKNQCIVISGESGSGKTESTNFLLHHLTALSQKGSHGSGVEQTILSAGPVLEAFGNAKTAHNNNSSRFGKFIQVNYKENGMVHGAVVQKYLLEKSRIVSQARNERNYHVFYYLLAGASDAEKQALHLRAPEDYNYLNRSGCVTLDNVDEKYEFSRLKQSMEMVGFSPEKQRRLFAVLSAVLLLGNMEFQPRKAAYHHDEAVGVKNPQTVQLISELLRVKQETLLAALTAKRARASGETLVINYKLPEAVAARDAIAKCLYGALFDWIVLQVNHALLSKKDTLRDHHGHSIGVLDIFGFEDFGLCNSFEQFCINYANEHLQYYFNQHVFKYEQEEYRKEGIRWSNIEFLDNTACLHLIEGKPNGLLCLLDDQCNFPGASNETLLQKFNSVHKDNPFYEVPQRRENAFIVRHYAGKVKYQVAQMREKNLDFIRQDILSVLKNSNMAFVRELVGADPVAVFRWAILRAFFRGYFSFMEAGKRFRQCKEGNSPRNVPNRTRNHIPNDNLIRRPLCYGSLATPYLGKPQRTNNEFSDSQNSKRLGSGSKSPHDVSHVEAKNDILIESTRNICDKRRRSVLYPEEAKVFERATQIVKKNKSFRPRERSKKGLKNLQSVKTLAGSTQIHSQLGTKARKQPLTVTAQFQQSLHSLMDTLNQANPFFIRCIKSNADKIPNKFDEETVQRQLRYTGMLETVRIRQAGYNVRLSYDEFIQLYRILLPRGLLSSQSDVKEFLLTLNLDKDNYQIGMSKIFMRESEKLKLDYRLHQQIMAGIVTIQRWFRALMERRRFLRIKQAVVQIQAQWRMILAQRLAENLRAEKMAATQIQASWRAYRTKLWFKRFSASIVPFQAQARGYLVRKRVKQMRQRQLKTVIKISSSDLPVSLASDRLSPAQLPSPIDLRQDPDVHYGVQLASISESSERFASSPCDKEDSVDLRINNPQEDILGIDSKLRSMKLDSRPSSEDYPLDKKGSNDSLSSQRSDSGAPVRDKLHKAKKQFQALIGPKSKKMENGSESAYSDSEIDNNNDVIWTKQSEPSKPCLTRSPRITGDSRFYYSADHANSIGERMRPPQEPQAPARGTKRKEYSFPSEDSERGERSAPGQYKQNKWTLKSSIGKDLKRRNSDPAAQNIIITDKKKESKYEHKTPVSSSPSYELLEWKGTTIFTIAGHKFRKLARFSKEDRCAYCNKPMDAFVTQGHKCSDCKHIFHTKCIQNGGVLKVPCLHAVGTDGGGGIWKYRKQSRVVAEKSNSQTSLNCDRIASSGGKFSLTGTSEFTDSTDKIISDARELKLMQDFITKKIHVMESEEVKKPSKVDKIFKQALREFKDNLVATYSVVNKQGDKLNIKYKDLIANFLHVMETVCNKENTDKDFPVTMGVNAFRGFMNEFTQLTKLEAEKPGKLKRKKEKKQKGDEPIKYAGHIFHLTIINIPTACEICSSFFMWPLERGLVCQNCKLTCHKKCYLRSNNECGKDMQASSGVSRPLSNVHQVFGVPVHKLATGDGKVPLVFDRLVTTIEMYGIYTEGIYRKSGVTSKVKELKMLMEKGNIETVEFEKYQVHVLASVLKCFFREMPEPLLTFDAYDDFLRAATLTEDRVSTLYAILKKLPKPNFDLMERLIFHLARVALHEGTNRMNAGALAIVFAPCILRTNKVVPAQVSLHDIGLQTQVVEVIITEKMSQVSSTLEDINTLDTACHTATNRLSSLRSSKIFNPDETLPVKQNEVEEMLMGHLEVIEKEKEILTSKLPSLTRSTSDDDLLSTDDGSLDDVDTGAAQQPLVRQRPVTHRLRSRQRQPMDSSMPQFPPDDDPIMV
ncbi:unconventional myosin-IXb isoform X2 [Bemisia tabaci]|uniref:unconventional myosin-IXb isoform X2 n=1 Tax=Bemisia tabaci TaxID=7038 RepID=UPI0008F9A559|nr:PREDICTED: unconventional myosin-IXa-like isoform X2 [Bemisia tabaci]